MSVIKSMISLACISGDLYHPQLTTEHMSIKLHILVAICIRQANFAITAMFFSLPVTLGNISWNLPHE